MKNSNDFIDAGKQKLEQLKTVFDEMEVQLALGKAEAREMFEREKKNLNTFIQEQKARFKKENESAESHWEQLRDRFEALETQLTKATPDAKDGYDDLKRETLHSIYELENAMREAYGELGSSMRMQLDSFKVRLDSYRIQLALSAFDSQDEADKRLQSLRDAVTEIRTKMDKEAEDANKLDDFADEMSASLDHMKKAFSDLFSK
jgi:hypothetical protein